MTPWGALGQGKTSPYTNTRRGTGMLPVSNYGQDGHATALVAAPPRGVTIFLDHGAKIG